jgi:hypothetical protein
MDSPETLATWTVQRHWQHGQSRDTGNMDSPETLATWTVQRHWQHLTHKTKDEDKQNNKTQTQHNNEN